MSYTNNTKTEKVTFTVRPTNNFENMYTYTQSAQLLGQTGCIGHLRADMDADGNGFFSSWENHCKYLKTDEFKEEFDEVINELRETFLKNRRELLEFCLDNAVAKMSADEESYGFRVDTDKYSYMMRLNPNKGEYNMYCYCYRKDWLDMHLNEAKKGIRFIDPVYHDLFILKDGGKVRVISSDGSVDQFTCRYIDTYHVEIRSTIYHICELADMLEKSGSKIEPVVE